MSRLLCLLILMVISMIIFVSDLNAQKQLFTVIAASGQVLFTNENGNNKWNDLTTGSKLFSGDKVKIGDNCYLGLSYLNGRTLELTKEGQYDVDELSKKLSSENTSVTQKLTDYVISEMLVKNKNKSMKYLAGVVRQNLTYIDKDFPASTVILDSLVTFRWFPLKGDITYALRIMNSSNKTILLEETKDTSITVNVSDLELVPDSCYMWYVFDPENEMFSSDSSCIMVTTKARLATIEDSLKTLEEDLIDNQSGLNQIIYATFFENNNMNLNALDYYDKALKYYGNVEEFRKKYVLFLIRTGLYKRAQVMLKKWNIAEE